MLLMWLSSLMTWNGSHFIMMDILDQMLNVGNALYLMPSLPLVESQEVENAYLPYHSSLEVCLNSDEVDDKIPCCLCGEMHPKKLLHKRW